MADPFIGEIKMISFNFPPRGWAFCNGQLLQIAQNQALFSLLGTTYGGNGVQTFALPNLQGKVPVHSGNGATILGQIGGETTHTLNANEIPSHTHSAFGSGATADVNTPANAYWASNTGFSPYATGANEIMSPSALTSSGSQPHENMSPYLTINYCIALVGIYPSRN